MSSAATTKELPLDPHSWTSEHVCQWIREVKNTHKKQHYFSKVKESRYKNFRGEMLCSLRKDIFLAFESGFAGEHLFEDLQKRIRISAECQTSRMDKHRQSSAAAFPLAWVSEDDPSRKVSFEYPPDQLTYQAQAIYDKDPIRTAHVDQFKEDFHELDEYASVILEYGELPDPDHYFTDSKRILRALFHLQPPMGKNYSGSLEMLLPSMLQDPFFRSASSAVELPQDELAAEKVLTAGQMCLMVDVDTVIGSLFKNHHCKGTSQAEAILNSTFNLHVHLRDITFEGIIRPPPVLLIPHPKTPVSSSSSLTIDLEQKKRSSDLGYKSSDDGTDRSTSSLAEGEGKTQKPRPKLKFSPSSPGNRVTEWKSEISNNGNQIHAFSQRFLLTADWNPALCVTFLVNGRPKAPVTLQDAGQITLQVTNPWLFSIGFSLRVYPLSRPYNPEIFFPGPFSGLYKLDKHESWKLEAELHCQDSDWCILELLVCQVLPRTQWNVQRHAVELKTLKNITPLRRAPPLHPGKKAHNLKAVVGWCVHYALHSGSLISEARTILTQALTLPDFHRPELRGFIMACLTVLAKSLFESTGQRQYFRCLIAFHKHAQDLVKVSRMVQTPRLVNLCSLTERLLDSVDVDRMMKTIRPAVSGNSHDLAVRLFKSYKDHPSLSGGSDHHITLDSSTSLFIPAKAARPGTKIKVATISCNEIARRMHTDGANKVVTPFACVQVATEPRMVSLNCPLELRVVGLQSTNDLLVMTATDIRGPWSDCTESFQVQSVIEEEEEVTVVSLKSPSLGWITPVTVEWKPSVIAKQALQDVLREEPISVRVSVFASNPSSASSNRTRQIIVHLSPLSARGPLSSPPVQPGSRTYKQIGEGQNFLSVAGSQLLVDLEGNFTAENEEDSLQQLVLVPESNSDRMVEKWVRLQEMEDDNSDGLTFCGVMKIYDTAEGRQNEVARVPLKASF